MDQELFSLSIINSWWTLIGVVGLKKIDLLIVKAELYNAFVACLNFTVKVGPNIGKKSIERFTDICIIIY